MSLPHDSPCSGRLIADPARPNVRRPTQAHACAFTILPMGEVDARFAAKDCKKLVRLVALPVPPRSETRVLKLVCSELSAEVVELVAEVESVELDELVELVEPLVNEAMRLCTSAANPVPALEPVPDVALQPESEFELAPVASVLLEFDWA